MTCDVVPLPGARMRFRLDGPRGAPVVVLANSLGTTMSLWDRQVNALTRNFQVARYDLRGHGETSVSELTVCIPLLGEDVLALLNRLDVRRAHFCGLSLGGIVGQWLGAHAPERLIRLILCNTAAVVGPRSLWDARVDSVRRGGMASIADAVLARWLSPAFSRRQPSTTRSLRSMLMGIDVEGYVAACLALRDMDQQQSAPSIRVPTLVLAGEHDQATPPAASRWLAEHIEGARCVKLPAAHLSNIEAAAAFNQCVLSFLTAEEAWSSDVSGG